MDFDTDPKNLSFKQMRALLTNPETREVSKKIQSCAKELNNEVKVFKQSLDEAIQIRNEVRLRDKAQKKAMKEYIMRQERDPRDFLATIATPSSRTQSQPPIVILGSQGSVKSANIDLVSGE